jgi:hypothetical protein
MLAGVLTIFAGCGGGDGLSPSPENPADAAVPTDSTAIDSTLVVSPGDSATAAGSEEAGLTTLTGATAPGIVFGTYAMKTELLGTIHTGSRRAPDPGNIVSLLTGARAKAARMVVSLTGGSVSTVKNSDGTFSLSKWKARVAGYKTAAFGSFITDGTILGHYLLDEPYNPSKWGGKIISHSTLEEMARYSKQIWPGMITLVRAPPTWLGTSSITYTYLDAGWAQYEPIKGDAATWVAKEVAAAQRKGLGLVVGLNVLNGGDGSSGIRGTSSGRWSMSANEIRTKGAAMMSPARACGFMMWTYNETYYGRSDIKSAMAELSNKAKAHVKTSCRQ